MCAQEQFCVPKEQFCLSENQRSCSVPAALQAVFLAPAAFLAAFLAPATLWNLPMEPEPVPGAPTIMSATPVTVAPEESFPLPLRLLPLQLYLPLQRSWFLQLSCSSPAASEPAPGQELSSGAPWRPGTFFRRSPSTQNSVPGARNFLQAQSSSLR